MPLYKLTVEYLPLILTWRNAPEVRQNMYSTHEISEAEHRAWFARIEHDPQARWYIHKDQNQNPDGVVYFSTYQPENQSSFWGFYTAPEAPSGTGTKLGLDALNEAFYVLGLHKLNAEVLITNERSRQFHEKLGFCVEGRFRDYHFNGERFIDVFWLGMLESVWSENRPKIESRILEVNSISGLDTAKGG